MHPNIIGLVASVGIVLSLLSGKLFAYAMERIISRRAVPKCSEGRCGKFGWIVARRDSESCHALCASCGWMSHFDSRRWQELKKR
jgi:hypothetical protein